MTRNACKRLGLALALANLVAVTLVASPAGSGQQTSPQLPSTRLKFGVFVARFDPGGTFTLEGDRWPSMRGSWKSEGDEIELQMSGGPNGCDRKAQGVALGPRNQNNSAP